MSRNLIDLLEVDHDRIRALKEEIRVLGREDEFDEKSLLDRIRTLQALVLAHSKGEELALYSLFRHTVSTKADELRHFSLEGFEEHEKIEQTLKDIVDGKKLDRRCLTKFTVASTLLDHHLDSEEEDFFPEVRNLLGEDELAGLAEVYARKRDQVLGPQGRQLIAETGARSARPF